MIWEGGLNSRGKEKKLWGNKFASGYQKIKEFLCGNMLLLLFDCDIFVDFVCVFVGFVVITNFFFGVWDVYVGFQIICEYAPSKRKTIG